MLSEPTELSSQLGAGHIVTSEYMKDHELFSPSTGLLRTECEQLPFDLIAQLLEHYKSVRRISNKPLNSLVNSFKN